jgi:hypothetical protein
MSMQQKQRAFTHSQIDHFVMAITAAEVVSRHACGQVGDGHVQRVDFRRGRGCARNAVRRPLDVGPNRTSLSPVFLTQSPPKSGSQALVRPTRRGFLCAVFGVAAMRLASRCQDQKIRVAMLLRLVNRARKMRHVRYQALQSHSRVRRWRNSQLRCRRIPRHDLACTQMAAIPKRRIWQARAHDPVRSIPASVV